MNYQKIYDEIIIKAQSQVRTKNADYYESHHIVPSSLGGQNTKDNLVLLTAREHFVCHWLLYKMTSGVDKNKMAHAWFSMSRISDGQKREKISSRKYEYAKQAHAKSVSERTKGVPYSKEIKRRRDESNVGQKISKSLKGKNKGKSYEEIYGSETAEKLKEKRRKSKIGYTHNEETRKKISESRMGQSSWNKGKTFSEETCKRISEARKGKSNNKLKYTVITPLNEHIDIDESVGLRKWLEDTYNEKICTSIKTSLKIGEPVQRGKWKGYSFYAESRK
jgi:hypothetical protein